MPLINKDVIDAAYTNFRADFEAGRLAIAPMSDRFALKVKSVSKEENYAWLGAFNSLREWIGDRHLNGLTVSGFTIVNRDFENTVTVHRNDIDDDRIGVLSGAFRMLGESAAMHPDELVFDLVRNGSTQPCYDGVPFFSASHPLDPLDEGKGSVANADLTNPDDVPSWVLLDCSKVIKPFIFQTRRDYNFIRKDRADDERVFMSNDLVYGVDARVSAGYGLWQLAYGSNKALDATHFAAARASMMSLKSTAGRPLGIKPNVLLVSPGAEEDALKLLNLDTSHYKGAAELIVCPWL